LHHPGSAKSRDESVLAVVGAGMVVDRQNACVAWEGDSPVIEFIEQALNQRLSK
jgi:hypothetical protein